MSNEQQAQSLDEINEKFKKDMLDAFDKMTKQAVAWRFRFVNPFGGDDIWLFNTPEFHEQRYVECQPLYAAPTMRDLSDKEVFSVAREFLSESDASVTDVISCARAILAKAKEKV